MYLWDKIALLLYFIYICLAAKIWDNATTCGDLVVEVIPGWRLFNEDNTQQYLSRENVFPFPIIFYGAGQQAQEVIIPVTTDRIAPTIAKAIRIRAPNACASSPLF